MLTGERPHVFGGEDFFREDYAGARALFKRLSEMAGVNLNGYQIPGQGPHGEALATDIVWIGRQSAPRVLVVQSGVHGVEAFAGSAIQCSLLENPPSHPAGVAMILIHIINPYGMAWLRRVNASNVDLNRNCLKPWEDYCDAPPGYERLNGLLNPPSPPRRDMFKLRAAYRLLRHGKAAVIGAAAQGQYEYPHGLFYGGSGLECETERLRTWLRDNIKQAARLLVVDVHTGLGGFGEHLVFPAFSMRQKVREIIEARFGCPLEMQDEGGSRYPVSGGVSSLYEQLFPEIDLQYLTVEFGTLPPVDVLKALRDENRHHFHSGGALGHWSKRALKRALCPESDEWKRRVVEDGRRLVENALWYLGRDFGAATERG